MNVNNNLFNDISQSINSSLNFGNNQLFHQISGSINSSLGSPNHAPIQGGVIHQPFDPAVSGSPLVDPTAPPVISFATILDDFTNNRPDNLDEEIADAIASAAATYQLDPSLIRAVIRTESSYRPDAVSPAGAMGLMQLMPGTAASLGVEDPFDVWENVHGGTRYLRQLIDRFEGDLELALAAYNAGAGNVNRFGGVPPFRETQNYIPRVQRHKQNYLLEQYHLNNSR